MANSYLTTADVAHFNKTDMDVVINDILDDAPLVAFLAARTILGNTFKYARQLTNPAVGFRAPNDGAENTKGTYDSITTSLGVLDASFKMDIAVAEADERGAEHAMAIEAMAHLRQAFFSVEKQIIYGTDNVATNAFNGFTDLSTLSTKSSSMVIDATGSTASKASSVFFVRTGESDVELLWGQSGEIVLGDRQTVEADGSTTGKFPAYYHPITGWVGVKTASKYSVARIANLTEQSGKKLTDDLLYKALSLFPGGRAPQACIMSRRSAEQLRSSRTATNIAGIPAPRPTDIEGIPIIVSDSIIDTESVLA